MKKLIVAALAVVAAYSSLTMPASANIIDVGGGTATVTCSLSCAGFTLGGSPGAPTGMGTLSAALADQYTLANSNLDTEAAALNTLIGSNLFTDVDANQVDTGGTSSISFMTLAEYVILKIANSHVFLINTAMNQIAVDYLQTGKAGGLSHYTEFGNAVPLPNAVWLMAAGLAGFGFAGRRKQR